MYTYKLQEKLEFNIKQHFQNKELLICLLNLLHKINKSNFNNKSIVFIDVNRNYFSIKLMSHLNNLSDCTLEVYDNFYDISICNEEFFIQKQMPSINKVCEQIEEILSNKIVERTIKTKKGYLFRKDISFNFNKKSETIGSLNLKYFFAKKIIVKKEYAPWLCS